MGDARAAFLDAAATAVQLLERHELAERWHSRSVLREFSVAALAGHLSRGMTTVERYLDGPARGEAGGISAAGYFDFMFRSADINEPENLALSARRGEAHAGL